MRICNRLLNRIRVARQVQRTTLSLTARPSHPPTQTGGKSEGQIGREEDVERARKGSNYRGIDRLEREGAGGKMGGGEDTAR